MRSAMERSRRSSKKRSESLAHEGNAGRGEGTVIRAGLKRTLTIRNAVFVLVVLVPGAPPKLILLGWGSPRHETKSPSKQNRLWLGHLQNIGLVPALVPSLHHVQL